MLAFFLLTLKGSNEIVRDRHR